MFGFSKKQDQKSKSDPIQDQAIGTAGLSGGDPKKISTSAESDVYVMPMKFHPNQARGSSNNSLVIVIILFIIVAILVGSYFIYDTWQKSQKPVAEIDYNANINTLDNTNVSINNSNANTGTNLNLNANLGVDLGVSTSTDSGLSNNDLGTNTTTTTTTTSTIPLIDENLFVAPILSSDADADGLTDLEEGMIGTSPSRPDTDGDGYLDGAEIASGYSPVVAGGGDASKPENALFMTKLTTTFNQDNFSLLYLKDWSASLALASKQAVITTSTGEVIKISVKDNLNRVSAANWFLANNAGVDVSQLKTVVVGNLSGVSSPSGLGIYLTDPEMKKLYVFEYIMDKGTEFRYPNFFKLMISSFKVVANGSPMGDQTGPNNGLDNNTSTGNL